MQTAEVEMHDAVNFDHVIATRTRDEDFAALLHIWEGARRCPAA